MIHCQDAVPAQPATRLWRSRGAKKHMVYMLGRFSPHSLTRDDLSFSTL